MRQIGYNAFWSGGMGLGAELDSAPAAGPALTAPGSIDVSTFKIGTTQTITPGTATATGGGAITYEVQHLSDGEVKSAVAAYAHVAADDTETGVAQWRAVETGGTNPGATPWQTVASGVITYPAPTAAGALVNQSFTENSGAQTYDASGDFTGSALVYSLTTAPTGVTINSATGVVSFDTDTLSQQTGTSIVVTATNSGGSVNSGFSLAITAGNTAPVITGVPTISGSAVEGQTLTASPASVAGSPTPTRTWQWYRNTTAISGATAITYTVQAADIGNTIKVRQTETNVAGSDFAESAATAAVTGWQITLTGVSFNGTDTISMTVNRPGTVYYMITDNATETAAAIIAGTGAIDSGSFAVTSGVNNGNISYPNVTAGDHYLHIVADAATSPSPSSVDSGQYTFPSGDTTAPTLSSPADAANGQTASTGSVSTDEGNGALYWVVTTSATAPSAAQVKLGQDNTGTAADGDSGSQAVSATGTQNITPSGLTASTAYTTHFMHEDAAGNQSAVASASGFTTASAGGSIPTIVGSNAASFHNAFTIAWPAGHASGDLAIVFVEYAGNQTKVVEGDLGTGWTELADIGSGTNSSDCRMTVFTKTATSGAEADVTIPDTTGSYSAAIIVLNGQTTFAQLGSETSNTASQTAVSISGGTTTNADTRLVWAWANRVDSDTVQITSWTDSNQSNVAHQTGTNDTRFGTGGGVSVGSGEKAATGTVGPITATQASASKGCGLLIEVS